MSYYNIGIRAQSMVALLCANKLTAEIGSGF